MWCDFAFRQAIEGTFENTVGKNQPFFSADLPKWSNWFISANPDSEDLLKMLLSDARVTLRSSSASTFAMILKNYKNHQSQHDDDDGKNPEDIPTEDLPIGKNSVGISSVFLSSSSGWD